MVEHTALASRMAAALKSDQHFAILGSREIGKTSFMSTLSRALAYDTEDGPYKTLVINLKRAISMSALISCIREALEDAADPELARLGRQSVEAVEREFNINLKVFGYRQTSLAHPAPEEEVLNSLLKRIRQSKLQLVIILDEFQRLAKCSGDPVLIIDSALMGTNSSVKVVFSGSIRHALELMLEDTNSPTFGRVEKVELPRITRSEFFDFIQTKFQATNRLISASTIEHLLDLTKCHPKRTQQLAGKVWEMLSEKEEASIRILDTTLTEILNSDAAKFESMLDMLSPEKPGERYALGMLVLLAIHNGEPPKFTKELLEEYGLVQHNNTILAFSVLESKGLIHTDAQNRRMISDPFFTYWLQSYYSFSVSRKQLLPSED